MAGGSDREDENYIHIIWISKDIIWISMDIFGYHFWDIIWIHKGYLEWISFGYLRIYLGYLDIAWISIGYIQDTLNGYPLDTHGYY